MAIMGGFKIAALALLAGATLAGAYTAFGPTVGVDSGLPAPGSLVAGGFYSGDYGPFYVRISGAYLPFPPQPTHYQDWPPPSPPTDDRGYASSELIGAHFPGSFQPLGLGIYYKFGRGQRYYHKHIYGPTIESWMENYVAFKHDVQAVAAYRVWTDANKKAVVWGGLGLSHFRRHGLRTYYYSDFYNPENYLEIITPLDTRLTSLAAGVGIEFRVRFAGPFGFYGSARGVVPIADIYLQGYDRSRPGANVALTWGGLVGW